MTDDTSLEAALDDIERHASASVRALSSALKEAKRAEAAAGSGQLRELRQALDHSARLAREAAATAGDARDGWAFDEQAYFASGAYTKELLALAADEGVQAFESDDRILCYPVIV
ncbi:MAG: hypothetical protein ACRDZW_02550, partial [Acidimicrobiales bacterium]